MSKNRSKDRGTLHFRRGRRGTIALRLLNRLLGKTPTDELTEKMLSDRVVVPLLVDINANE